MFTTTRLKIASVFAAAARSRRGRATAGGPVPLPGGPLALLTAVGHQPAAAASQPAGPAASRCGAGVGAPAHHVADGARQRLPQAAAAGERRLRPLRPGIPEGRALRAVEEPVVDQVVRAEDEEEAHVSPGRQEAVGTEALDGGDEGQRAGVVAPGWRLARAAGGEGHEEVEGLQGNLAPNVPVARP